MMDNGGTANGGIDTSLRQTLLISVLSVNDAPSFMASNEISILEDAGAQAIAWAMDISAGPADENGQTLTFNILSNNNADLFENQPEIASDGSLTFTAKTDSNGEAELVIQLMDNGGTANGGIDTSLRQTLLISVLSVNDAPSFTADADISILEDVGAQAIPWATDISAGPADEIGQALTFNILSNNNTDLFENQPEIASDGTLTFIAKADANGEAELVIQLMDNGGTANGGIDTSLRQTLLISVFSVNDAPSFVKGADISIETNTELQTFTAWASSIMPGPSDETLQTLTFIIESNDNEVLFEMQPSIAPDGTLTFKANQDATGIANIIVKLQDNGGTDNGGIDISAAQGFTITLTPSGG
ncbi:MAG: hypothetical protein IPJ74_12105 [Saprospiraceae bacterium]|nr:hypothetical protein [Saprospiraceae bacterium]